MSVQVSVIIPVYNEEKYIERCVDSLLKQDYPRDEMEWIFVDGNSQDRTVDILNSYKQRYPNLIDVYQNPKRIVPCAMNIGIAAATGEYIVRLDAHAEYPKNYITHCVRCLETTQAENVGGLIETRAEGIWGRAIAKMLSTKFGVGNSAFRTNQKSGYVDTVPFGTFRRTVFFQYGGYDERLVRNEDNELNYRIRKRGGLVYLSSEITLTYYCRDSYFSIIQMALNNGMWNVITMKLCPGSMGLRHFVPLLFVLSLVGLGFLSYLHPFFVILLGVEIALYSILDILFSWKAGTSLWERLRLMILFPTFHLSYGVGSIRGACKLITKQYRDNDYTPPFL